MALNNLASLYSEQKKNQQAKPLYRRSLVILEKALGPEDPMVARRTIWRSSCRPWAAGTRQSTMPAARWKSGRRFFGPDDPEVAFSLAKMGLLRGTKVRAATKTLSHPAAQDPREIPPVLVTLS